MHIESKRNTYGKIEALQAIGELIVCAALDGTIHVKVDDVAIREGGMLGSVFGVGDTFETALDDYICKLSGKRLSRFSDCEHIDYIIIAI